jgi:hypothetical protein
MNTENTDQNKDVEKAERGKRADLLGSITHGWRA